MNTPSPAPAPAPAKSQQPTPYVYRRAELLAIRALEARSDGAKVLILEGAPGTGKTALGRAFAAERGADVEYFLCHHWVTEEEMFVGVDVGRVAAGVQRAEDAYRPGVLMRAVEKSRKGLVVVIIDELDKAPERAETLLLEFLQSARVYGPRGEVYQGNAGNIVVFITTNGLRPLMEPTLRRGFRIKMQFLPPHVEADILRKRTGAPTGAIRLIVRFANTIRESGGTAVSLQEMENLLRDLKVAESAADVAILIDGWLIKDEADKAALVKAFSSPAAALWGEWTRGRK